MVELRVRPRRRRSRLRRLAGLLGWVVPLGVLAVSVPTPWGPPHLGVTVVSGESMLPTYEPGDLVVTWRTGSYPVGKPIVYRIPAGEVGAGMKVVHRVEERSPNGEIVTLGDNNDHVDPWHPTDRDVRGEVVVRVPRGGILLRWFGSPLVLALVSGLLTGAAVLARAGRGGGLGPPGGGVSPPWRHRRSPPPSRLAPRVVVGVGSALLLVLAPTRASAAALPAITSADLTTLTVPSSLAANPVSYEQTLTSETALQYCATVTVTNHSDQAVEWEITLNISQQPYDATSLASSYNVTTVSFQPDLWRVRGVPFNSVLAPGASYEWGYCGARSPTALADADATAVVTSTGGGQYCATVTVTTASTDWVHWRVTLDHTTTGLTDSAYWLAGAPAGVSNATTVSFADGAWVVSGSGSNEYVRAGTPATWSYCAPAGAAAPLVDATVSVAVTSSDSTQYCATVTVSTTSTSLVKWRATIDHATPGLSADTYWLNAEPANHWSSETLSFGSGTWVVKGTSSNDLVRAGQPTTFGFCAPTNQDAALVPADVAIVTTPSGDGHYCANVVVSTTSVTPVRWKATLTGLPLQPTNSWNVQTVSYEAGTWVVRGVGWNDLVSATSPQTWGFCV